MTKIVINRCHGGFDLSPFATREYLQRRGVSWIEETSPDGLYVTFIVEGEYFSLSSHLTDRADPLLVAVVEELGEAAAGEFAELAVVELDPGTRYRICEYDGMEHIETPDTVPWKTA